MISRSERIRRSPSPKRPFNPIGTLPTTQDFDCWAGYIFGGNAAKQKMAMTAPVIEAPAPNVPAWIIRFVMPRGLSLTNLPRPDASGVVLREEPAARSAVVGFSGLATDAAVAAKTAFGMDEKPQSLANRRFSYRSI